MLFKCAICSDLFVGLDEVCSTTCGHMFHYQCILQWTERSKSCPECRTNTNEKNIHRVYFNISNEEVVEDSGVLHNKIDSLNFQISLKNKEIKDTIEKNSVLHKQNNGLREEIKKLEDKEKTHMLNINVLKQQIQSLQKLNKDGEKAVIECTNLKKQLELLKSVKSMITGTTEEVDELVNNYSLSMDSMKALATYVSVLKKGIQTVSTERRKLNKKLRESKSALQSVTLESKNLQDELKLLHTTCDHLKQDLLHAENEKTSLVKKVKGLEAAIVSPSASHPRESALRRLLAESPAPAELQPTQTELPEQANMEMCSQLQVQSSSITSAEQTEARSPFLNVKFSSIGLTPLRSFKSTSHHMTTNSFSIFRKNRITGASQMEMKAPEMAYDGLGGHSKLDEFPTPTPKLKKQKRLHTNHSGLKMKKKGIDPKTLTLESFSSGMKCIT